MMTRSVALLALVLALSTADLAAGNQTQSGEADRFATEWFLVRLETPLRHDDPNATFPLRTGKPDLDAAIEVHGVDRIQLALRVAAREARCPKQLERHGLDRTYRFHLAERTDIPTLVERFSNLPGIEFAEPDYVARAAEVIPTDSLFPDQWNLDAVHAPDAWEIARGEDVIMGIVDSGIDSDHPDLIAKLVQGYDFVNDNDDPEDDAGHGTAVASIASASTNNSEGIAGVCWDCRLMPLKAFSPAVIYYAAMADSLVWATDHGAQVINMSGGGPNSSATLLSAMSYAADAGVVLVSAAGNDGDNGILYPASYVESLAIGATDFSDQRLSTSSFGPQLDVVAPGQDIPAAEMNGDYQFVSGTSHAAPHVTGLAGVMATVNPAIGRDEARYLIRSCADDEVGDPAEDTPGFDLYYGWGRINMHRTLQATQSAISLRVDGKAATRVYLARPNPVATSHDFIRGDLAALSESWAGVDLGEVVCLEDDSPDPDTTGDEDIATPAPGQGFFYLARFTGLAGTGSYGGSSSNRDRWIQAATASLAWTAESNQAYSNFGISVSGAGDVNGDGYDDVIVGASLYDNDQSDEGATFVYLGSATGLVGTPVWSAEGNQTGSGFGWSVASAGDVNGDGHDDVIVGAPYHDSGETDEGRVYVYLGNDSGLETTPNRVVESDQESAWFGWRVRPAGDVNCDGYDDVVVVAYLYDDGQTNEGKVFLYTGSDSGLSESPAWSYPTGQAEARMAGAGTAGDVNNDGCDDLIVGSHGYDNGQTNEGRVWVFHGSGLGLAYFPSRVLESDVPGASFGYSTYTAGDVNGDGFDDVVVGAFAYSNGMVAAQGAAFVYAGSETGVTNAPAWSLYGSQADAWFGLSAQTAGDVNNDDYDDIIVSSERYDVTRTDQGRAWVFLGSASGLSNGVDWFSSGLQTDEVFGWRSAGAGDINGDGFDDVIVGARRFDNGETNEGRAVVYHGPLLPSTDCSSSVP
jgi:hypothetical protein